MVDSVTKLSTDGGRRRCPLKSFRQTRSLSYFSLPSPLSGQAVCRYLGRLRCLGGVLPTCGDLGEGKYRARGEPGEFCQYHELCEGAIFLVLSPAPS